MLRSRPLPVLALALLAAMPLPALAQKTPNPGAPLFLPAELPEVDLNPVMDGMATVTDEWDEALRLPDSFFFGDAWRSGFYYFERKNDWLAVPAGTPKEGAGIVYEGITTFVAHDIIGSGDTSNPLYQFRLDEPHDWNSFDFPVPTGMAKIWVFDGENDDDDSNWIAGAEGLLDSHLIPEGAGLDLIDDRGFIARLNDDPMTDVHWFEGMPEPGDVGWDWETYHWVFGRHTFGQSFQDLFIDPDPENAVPHEVYEACAYRPDQDPDDDDPPPPFCLWWDVDEVEEVTVRDVWVIQDGTPVKGKLTLKQKKKIPVLKGQWWIHMWDDDDFPVGVPDFFTWASFIHAQWQAAAQAAGVPVQAQQDVSFVLSFLQGFMFALIQHQYDQAFQTFKFMSIHHKRAVKKGFDRLAWLQQRMLLVTFVYVVMAHHVIALDIGPAEGAGGGLTIEDEDLGKVSRGFYKFGKSLRASATKGSKGAANVLNSLNKLKQVGKQLQQLDAEG